MPLVDTLIHAGWVVPVVPAGAVLPEHSIAIDAGRIVGLLPTAEARRCWQARQTVERLQHIVCPGLVNLHGHSAMTLLRGLADDQPLDTWLQQHIWPAEGRHLSAEFVQDGTLIACAEMLRGGTTCFNDMYFFPEAIARAALQSGMRACIGAAILEFPSGYASDADDYIAKALAARDAFLHEPLLQFSLAPHAPYTVSDSTFERIVTLAGQLQMPVHMHVQETALEVSDSIAQYGMRPLARLKSLGLLSPDFLAVHAVHLNDTEIALLAEHGCHVAHNPSSNMKLASGIAPVSALLAAGVNVGIGTDSAASNNRLDMFTEMRSTALLAKVATGRADAVPAWQALQMATLNGAAALGLQDQIGSLETGKAADLISVHVDNIEALPCFDPISHLVYCLERHQVNDCWVNGNPLLTDRQPVRLNLPQLTGKARWWHQRIGKQPATDSSPPLHPGPLPTSSDTPSHDPILKPYP